MEFAQLIRERYSVRRFTAEPVTDAELQSILEAARLAPTAVNKQPQRLLVLRSAGSLEKLRACTKYCFDAPLVIAVCANTAEAWVRPHDQDNSAVVDAAIVGTHLMLAVHNLGLGSTWVGFFDPVLFRRDFKLPAHIEPVALFPIGHPAPEAQPSPMHAKRRPLAETVAYETF